jgi:hypothetical protein
VEKHRESLQGCCDALSEKQAEGEKSLKDVADAGESLKKTAEKARGEISKQKNDIIKAVEDVFQKKINEVDRLYVVNKELLSGRTNKVESFLDKVKCASNMSKNVLQKGSNEEIIESHKMVKERVEMVKDESETVKDMPTLISADKNWFAASQVNSEVILNLFGGGMIRIFSNMFVST